ncbi:MAG: hypothetical protein NT094_04835 [Candidatus Staskawiczbacteria bacterium]|nr:hypothetical protein [Candidatus Staskawiczbacteria bacterium]
MKEKEEGLHIESDKQESGQQFPERAAGEMQQLDSDIKAAELKDASEIKSAKESLEKTFPEEIKEPVIEKPERKLEPTEEEDPGLLH